MSAPKIGSFRTEDGQKWIQLSVVDGIAETRWTLTLEEALEFYAGLSMVLARAREVDTLDPAPDLACYRDGSIRVRMAGEAARE